MKGIKKYLHRVFIDGFSGMALGLFSTLIIGTIVGQIAKFVPGAVGMYNLWKELFSRTAFSGNKHSQIDRCDL